MVTSVETFHIHVKNENDPWCVLASISQLLPGQNWKSRTVLKSCEPADFKTDLTFYIWRRFGGNIINQKPTVALFGDMVYKLYKKWNLKQNDFAFFTWIKLFHDIWGKGKLYGNLNCWGHESHQARNKDINLCNTYVCMT